MDEKVLNKVMETLKESLPEMQINALKDFIEEAEELKDELETTKKQRDQARTDRDEYKKRIEELELLKNNVEEMEAGFKKLREERAQFELDKQLVYKERDCEKEKAHLLKHIFGTVFRNTTLRKHVIENVSKDRSVDTPIMDNGYQSGTSQERETETLRTDTTITETEE